MFSGTVVPGHRHNANERLIRRLAGGASGGVGGALVEKNEQAARETLDSVEVCVCVCWCVRIEALHSVARSR